MYLYNIYMIINKYYYIYGRDSFIQPPVVVVPIFFIHLYIFIRKSEKHPCVLLHSEQLIFVGYSDGTITVLDAETFR